MARALVHVPAAVKRGAVFEIRALISHPMETGFRAGLNGAAIPRDIITTFACDYAGAEVFRAAFSPAIAANPFISFSTIALESGPMVLTWAGDNGFEARETVMITVTG